jgi:hypothetical protein
MIGDQQHQIYLIYLGCEIDEMSGGLTAQNVVTAMINAPGFSCYPNSTAPNDGLTHLY